MGGTSLVVISGLTVAATVGLIGVSVLGAALVSRRRLRTARRRAEAVADAHGLRYVAGPLEPPGIAFRQLTIGRARRARHAMWREGDTHEASVFDYRFTTGSGQQARTHRLSCAVFRTGIEAPHLVLERRDTVRRLLGRLGGGGIRLESALFNRRWHVSCDDERFAVTVLDPAMIDWLASTATLGSFGLELLGDRGLIVAAHLPVADRRQLLDLAHAFVLRLPRVTSDIYPGPR